MNSMAIAVCHPTSSTPHWVSSHFRIHDASQDMRRTDLLLENLAYLQREVDEVEHDAALLGIMLAESVQKREKDEDELFAASRQKKSNR
mmetsp:Transcript_59998/g.194530  ORF Transcript_59998/g.194530 Transcript_59998/m.194530 type:complete len:89 (-) Transcript_59998:81-347(-)